MNNTSLKQSQLTLFEPALRHILGLNSNELIHFNNLKKRNNAQADIIYFKNTIGYFIKVFPSYSQYDYTVPVEKYLQIQNANDLEYVMLTMLDSFTLLKTKDFLNLPYTSTVTNGIKQLHFEMFDKNLNPMNVKDSFMFNANSKTLYNNGTITNISKYYSNLSLKNAFLISDHKLGKLYTFASIDTDGSIMGWNQKDVKDYVDTVYGASTDDNVAAKEAFNKKVRRTIKKAEKSFELGERIEPLETVANNKDIKVFILPLEMFDNVKIDFLQYQNSHNKHVKKTEDIKAYQQQYQQTDKYKKYKKEYDSKHKS